MIVLRLAPSRRIQVLFQQRGIATLNCMLSYILVEGLQLLVRLRALPSRTGSSVIAMLRDHPVLGAPPQRLLVHYRSAQTKSDSVQHIPMAQTCNREANNRSEGHMRSNQLDGNRDALSNLVIILSQMNTFRWLRGSHISVPK